MEEYRVEKLKIINDKNPKNYVIVYLFGINPSNEEVKLRGYRTKAGRGFITLSSRGLKCKFTHYEEL